jgi:hypothetical protein
VNLSKFGRCVPGHRIARARPTWPTPHGGTRLRRAPQAVLRPSPLGAQNLARLLVRHRPDRGRDGTPGLRSPTHALRRTRLTGDLLHDLDGALAHERHWVSVVAHAVARDAAGGVGGVETRRRERLSWYTWCTYASLRLSNPRSESPEVVHLRLPSRAELCCGIPARPENRTSLPPTARVLGGGAGDRGEAS